MSIRNSKAILIFGLAFCLASQVFGYYNLANAGKRGLSLNSIEPILRLKDEQIDLATAVLVLSRDWGTKRTLHSYRQQIDNMAQEILRRVNENNI